MTHRQKTGQRFFVSLFCLCVLLVRTNAQVPEFMSADSITAQQNMIKSDDWLLVFAEDENYGPLMYKTFADLFVRLNRKLDYTQLLTQNSYSFSCLISEYLSGNDDGILAAYPFWGSRQDGDVALSFYQKLHAFNARCPGEYRFAETGINLEFDEFEKSYRPFLWSLRYFLQRSSLPAAQIERVSAGLGTLLQLLRPGERDITAVVKQIDQEALNARLPYDNTMMEIIHNYYQTVAVYQSRQSQQAKKREDNLLGNYYRYVRGAVKTLAVFDELHLPREKSFPGFFKLLYTSNQHIQFVYSVVMRKDREFADTHHLFDEAPQLREYFSASKGAWFLRHKKQLYLLVSD